MKYLKILLVSILFISLTVSGISQTRTFDPYERETAEERDVRMQWWREDRFGLFIHWGVYAVPAGTYKGEKIPGIGEWIMYRGKIPMAEYQEFAKEFNPDAWVKLARDAGMKYIVITSKHHDGFALFDSRVSTWDVVDATPYGKDLIAPLAEACKKYGIKLGLYYSQAQDWNQGGSARQKWDPAQNTNMDDYIDSIAVPQVKEILSTYNPAILWWDTPLGMTRGRANKLIPQLEICPGIIHNNRLGGAYKGDISTPEQHIPGTGLPGDWEACMTMNNTWGYKSYDHDWKSSPQLIHNLVDIASKGGNYLLNVGPTAEGLIPEPSVERLKAIGSWMKVNGESIYGTTASPCSRPSWGRITTKAGQGKTTLYLHVFKWPEDGKIFIPVDNTVTECFLLAKSRRKFRTESNAEGTTVYLTGKAPDPVCSVVKLDLVGPVSVTDANFIRQDMEGNILLTAERAQINSHFGSQTAFNALEDCIDQWTNSNVSLEWTFSVKTPGAFDITALTASLDSSALSLSLEKQSLKTLLPPNGDLSKFEAQEIGTIIINEAGDHTLILKPDKKQWKQIKLRSVTLAPAGN